MFIRKMISTSVGGVVVLGLALSSSPALSQADTDKIRTLDRLMDSETIKNIEHQVALDEIRRKAEIAAAKAELSKSELELKNTEREMEGVGSGSRMPFGMPHNFEGMVDMGQEHMVTPPMPTLAPEPEPEVVEEIEDPFTLLDRVFVTRIYGLGDDKEVTLYIDGVSYSASQGDTINDVKVDKVHNNKVTFSYDGKKKTAYVVSKATAGDITSKMDAEKERLRSLGQPERHTFIPARMH